MKGRWEWWVLGEEGFMVLLLRYLGGFEDLE